MDLLGILFISFLFLGPYLLLYLSPIVLLPILLRSDLGKFFLTINRFTIQMLILVSIGMNYMCLLFAFFEGEFNLAISYGSLHTEGIIDYRPYYDPVAWELWLHSMPPFSLGNTCFNSDPIVCNMAASIGYLSFVEKGLVVLVASIPSLLGLCIYWLSKRLAFSTVK